MPIDWEEQIGKSISDQDINITVKDDDRASSGVGNIDFNQLLSDSISGVQSKIKENQHARAPQLVERREAEPVVERGEIEQRAQEAASGFNRGIASLLGLPVDLAGIALSAAGVETSDTPFLGSRHLTSLLKKIGAVEEPSDETGRIIQRVAEEVGVSAFPAIRLARGAIRAGAGAGAALSAAGKELAEGTAAGIGAATAQQIAPDSVGAELIGTLAPSAIRFGASAATRGALRGGEAGRQTVERNIADFGAAGTTPSVSQATGNNRTSMLESTLGRIPGSAGVIREKAQQTQDQIQANIERIVNRVSGGQQVTPEIAGRRIEQGIEDFSSRASLRSEQLWTPVERALPADTPVRADNTVRVLDDMVSPTEGAENISRRIKRIRNPQAESLARALVSDLGEDGRIPYSALKPIRTEVGSLLSNTSLNQTIPRAQLKLIYGALTEDIRQSIIANSPTPEIMRRSLRDFERANQFTRGLHERTGAFLDKLSRKVTPEEIFFSATTGVAGRRGGTNARRLMRSLTKEQRQAVSATLVRQLGAANPSDIRDWNMNTFFRNYKSMSDEAKKAFFGRQDMDGLKGNLDQIQETIRKIKEGVETLSNPSGTAAAGANIAFTALAGQALLRGDINQLSMLGAGAAGANISAKLMTSPKFVNWLAKSTKIPKSAIPGHIARLVTISKDMPLDEQREVAAYLQDIQDEQ